MLSGSRPSEPEAFPGAKVAPTTLKSKSRKTNPRVLESFLSLRNFDRLRTARLSGVESVMQVDSESRTLAFRNCSSTSSMLLTIILSALSALHGSCPSEGLSAASRYQASILHLAVVFASIEQRSRGRALTHPRYPSAHPSSGTFGTYLCLKATLA